MEAKAYGDERQHKTIRRSVLVTQRRHLARRMRCMQGCRVKLFADMPFIHGCQRHSNQLPDTTLHQHIRVLQKSRSSCSMHDNLETGPSSVCIVASD